MESLKYKQVYDLLIHAKQPVFISDERVDGDSLGASLAMVDLMKARGIDVPVIVTREIPLKYQSLPHIEHCTADLSLLQKPEIDLVVSFDCSDSQYIRGLMEGMPNSAKLINIDHHDTNSRYGDVNIVVPAAPATTEVVYRFFVENRIPISKKAATCLFAGICFDTSIFGNAATNDQALAAGSDLVLCGAKVKDSYKIVISENSLPSLRVWGLVLERLRPLKDEDGATTYLLAKDLEEHGVAKEEMDSIANYVHSIIDTDSVYVYIERPDEVKVSMRSMKTDVGAIAKANGGGGHTRAAGYEIAGAHIECDSEGYPKAVKDVK